MAIRPVGPPAGAQGLGAIAMPRPKALGPRAIAFGQGPYRASLPYGQLAWGIYK